MPDSTTYGSTQFKDAMKGVALSTYPVGQSRSDGSGGSGSGEFDRFENLTGQLVQVPKSEIDKRKDA